MTSGNTEKTEKTVRLSVRELVEFVLKSGDISTGASIKAAGDAMLEGAKAHRKIQESQGSGYESEVPLKIEVPCFSVSLKESFFRENPEDPLAFLQIEGRADGILKEKDGKVLIDEIKGIYRDIHELREPVPVHLSQAQVYAFIYAKVHGLEDISVRITYVQLSEEDTGKRRKIKDTELRYFTFSYTFPEITEIFLDLAEKYRKWAVFIVKHRKERRESASGFPFPYAYRPGQREIMVQAYRTMEKSGRLFIQAPTGIGKTLAMLYPGIQAVGQGYGDKIFYLTAKTVTSVVAEDTMKLFSERGLRFSAVKITAKEKMCPLERAECDPSVCERAKGHFDRVNEAVYDIITHENTVTAEIILFYAEKHTVCPYELSLDVSLYTDVIICDYNYAFAPHVALQRYFSGGEGDYIFLLDEAHNLPARARDMCSATLVKEELLSAKKLFPGQKTILKWLEKANKTMLSLKRECDRVTVFTEEDFPNALLYELENLKEAILRFLDRNPLQEKRREMLDFLFTVSDFTDTAVYMSEGYKTYAAFGEGDTFFIKLFCIDPSSRLKERLEHIKSAVFFSATFLPINYYKELISGDREEPAIYVNSPFDERKRALLLSKDVSTKYTRRNTAEYRKIAEYICRLAAGKKGNYLVFFPSHKFLEEVREVLEEMLLSEKEEADRTGKSPAPSFTLLLQKRSMSEEERNEFLRAFENPHTGPGDASLLGLCVMGGVFSEGIDLKNEALIGVAVVGTGLPMVCTERELIRTYYEENGENGFDFAYRFPGFNKVMQAAGRLIRTPEDSGVILLLDERFCYRENIRLFPKEWMNYEETDLKEVSARVEDFWEKEEK